MALPGDLPCDIVVIGLDCSVIVDKVEKVRTGEVFSVDKTDFAVVVLAYKEIVSWGVCTGLRAVSDASFPYEGSEGREMFKEIRELNGEEEKADGFRVEMLAVLSTCDLSGGVVNNVISVALRRVNGDPVTDVL
ncbi:otogelin [Grus japonensis]|uniref:Otogelin n=1 Tax=Grus japonensis TaxID=30415 RepID=A0ABC9WXA0_GRUJA